MAAGDLSAECKGGDMRRVLVRCLGILVPAALAMVILAPLTAQAATTTVTYRVSNQLDPVASAAYTDYCGVPVEERDTGTVTIVSSTTKAGVTKTAYLQSFTGTYTNPDTGASLTLRVADNATISETVDQTGTYTWTGTFTGLNWLYLNGSGTMVSAGRGTETLIVTFDAQGNVTSVTFSDEATPHLLHSTDIICPALGGTA